MKRGTKLPLRAAERADSTFAVEVKDTAVDRNWYCSELDLVS